jgi:hypothetical protein
MNKEKQNARRETVKGKTSDNDSKPQVSPIEEIKPKRITLTDRLKERLKNTPQMRPHRDCVYFLSEPEFEEITEPITEKRVNKREI